MTLVEFTGFGVRWISWMYILMYFTKFVNKPLVSVSLWFPGKPLRKSPAAQYSEFSALLKILDLLFPYHPTLVKDRLPFSKSKMFINSIKYIHFF
jgi:hypothetical protein